MKIPVNLAFSRVLAPELMANISTTKLSYNATADEFCIIVRRVRDHQGVMFSIRRDLLDAHASTVSTIEALKSEPQVLTKLILFLA